MWHERLTHLIPHRDLRGILLDQVSGLTPALGDHLVGLYLTGSLTYGDFDPGSSDIDYLVVLKQPMAPDEFARVKGLHVRIGHDYPRWKERIEGSYITEEMFGSIEPPMPRPYFNGGQFWNPEPLYGNEWLINLFALRERGIALIGPDPKDLIVSVNVEDARRASMRDLFEEWVPKLWDPSFLESSHHQAFAVLTLCRILHQAARDEVVLKRVASAWVKETYDHDCIVGLVEAVERWEHGETMDCADGVRDFIAFALDQLQGEVRPNA